MERERESEHGCIAFAVIEGILVTYLPWIFLWLKMFIFLFGMFTVRNGGTAVLPLFSSSRSSERRRGSEIGTFFWTRENALVFNWKIFGQANRIRLRCVTFTGHVTLARILAGNRDNRVDINSPFSIWKAKPFCLFPPYALERKYVCVLEWKVMCNFNTYYHCNNRLKGVKDHSNPSHWTMKTLHSNTYLDGN